MPYKERDINKMYYTMGEVSAMFDVNQSLIRFYEKEFDVLQPKKNKKGNRYFTPEDIENLKIIFHLIRDKGYTLTGAKDHLKNNRYPTGTRLPRKHKKIPARSPRSVVDTGVKVIFIFFLSCWGTKYLSRVYYDMNSFFAIAQNDNRVL